MAIITPYDGKVAVWLVAGDQVGENSIDELAQTILTYAPAVSAIWVKTSDGSDWMAKYDTKAALHIDGRLKCLGMLGYQPNFQPFQRSVGELRPAVIKVAGL